MTVRQCNRLAVWGHRSEDIKFIKVYVYFNAHIVCFGFFHVVQKQILGVAAVWWAVVSKMFAPKIIKIFQSFFKSQTIMLGMLCDVFWFILTHISLAHFSPGSAEANIGWGKKKLAGHLMTSCTKNICTKDY